MSQTKAVQTKRNVDMKDMKDMESSSSLITEASNLNPMNFSQSPV